MPDRKRTTATEARATHLIQFAKIGLLCLLRPLNVFLWSENGRGGQFPSEPFYRGNLNVAHFSSLTPPPPSPLSLELCPSFFLLLSPIFISLSIISAKVQLLLQQQLLLLWPTKQWRRQFMTRITHSSSVTSKKKRNEGFNNNFSTATNAAVTP